MSARLEPVPMLDLVPEIEAQWDELMKAIEGVLRSGEFILGPNVEAFEREIAEYLGVKHAIGVNSGTDALMISLRALGIGPGDEVITTPFTFFATAESISNVGATPVFVDIEPVTFNIDPELIESAITSRTKAILPVHLYGHPAEMGRVTEIAKAHGLKVVEDCAQAMGAEYAGRKVGTFGQASAFSFFPSKNLGAFGDAGLIATDDDRVAELALMLRAHGSKRKYENEMLGFNSRLDELQAAILRVRLTRLDETNEGRRRLAERYSEWLADSEDFTIPAEVEGVRHVYNQYTIRAHRMDRDVVRRDFAEAGISTMVYYPRPLHRFRVFATAHWRCNLADQAAAEVLSLPITTGLAGNLQRRVSEALAGALLLGSGALH
ncbi:MAG: DegT/DnrJ/EryC1/StrS family aminotransferase [Actinomycetota bacterium]|nr:DegT/DnrJ/EryC1/StrS family aminotransferase [Actinomycetota bacterium]